MTTKDNDRLELLNFELGFLEAGGYGRSVKTPHTPTRIFQDSLSCLNFADPARPHPCGECLLIDYVPAELRKTDVPCHHIPLNDKAETIEHFEEKGNQERMEDAVKGWLKKTISKLETE